MENSYIYDKVGTIIIFIGIIKNFIIVIITSSYLYSTMELA